MRLSRVVWQAGALLSAAFLGAGQEGTVTTPAAATTESSFQGTAESVTGTENVVVGRFVVTTTTTSVATDKLQVSTLRPEPPPQPVVAAKEPAPAAPPEPPPAPRPGPRHKELPRTNSPLPLMAGMGGLLLGVSSLSRYLSKRA